MPESLLSADRGGAWLKARVLIGRWHGQFSNGHGNIAEAEKKSGNTEAGAVFPLEKQVREAISRAMLKRQAPVQRWPQILLGGAQRLGIKILRYV